MVSKVRVNSAAAASRKGNPISTMRTCGGVHTPALAHRPRLTAERVAGYRACNRARRCSARTCCSRRRRVASEIGAIAEPRHRPTTSQEPRPSPTDRRREELCPWSAAAPASAMPRLSFPTHARHAPMHVRSTHDCANGKHASTPAVRGTCSVCPCRCRQGMGLPPGWRATLVPTSIQPKPDPSSASQNVVRRLAPSVITS